MPQFNKTTKQVFLDLAQEAKSKGKTMTKEEVMDFLNIEEEAMALIFSSCRYHKLFWVFDVFPQERRSAMAVELDKIADSIPNPNVKAAAAILKKSEAYINSTLNEPGNEAIKAKYRQHTKMARIKAYLDRCLKENKTPCREEAMKEVGVSSISLTKIAYNLKKRKGYTNLVFPRKKRRLKHGKD